MQLASFVRKEVYHILRDRWTTVILLILPVIMLILFGFAISTEVKNTKVAVFDPANDQVTRTIVDRIEANEYFTVVKHLRSSEQIDQVFRSGEVGLVVAFSPDFQHQLVRGSGAQVQLVADAADPNAARTVVAYASNIIVSTRMELAGQNQVPYLIQPVVKLLYNPQMKGAFNFVPGVLGMILMLICAMMTSVSIAREKELGTMEVLLVSPVRPITIILAKAIPYFVLSIVNLVTILLMSVFILDVPIAGSLFWLVIVSLLFIFMALSLGILISSVVSSQLVALLVSGMAMVVPVILLSGMMFPVESMPWPLRMLAQAMPAKWYIAAVRKLMIQGLGFAGIKEELAVLGTMTAALMTLSLVKHKARLE